MLRTVFLLCVVTFSLVVTGAPLPNHGLSSTFSASDVNTVKTFLQSQADKFSNIHDAFYATIALARLDTKPTKSADICTLAKNTLRDKSVLDNLDAASIYHAVAIAKELKCDVATDKSFTDAIKTIIEEGDSVPHYYYAVLSALSLREKTKADISDDDITSVIEKIGDLTESDGTVRQSTEAKDGTLFNTGLVLQLYARLLTDLKLSEQDREHVDELASRVETILDLANEGDNTLSFSSDDGHSTISTTGEVVKGLQALSAALKKPVDITSTQLAQIGEYFLSHRYASSLEDAYYLVIGLRAVQQSPKAPLALTVEKSSILASAKGTEGHIKVKLSDIFDGPVAGKITLVKAHPVGKSDAILLANQEVVDSLNFLAAKPEQGFYALEFRAVPTDAAKHATIDSATRRVKVIGSVSVTDFELHISDSREKGEGSTYKAEYPNKIEDSIQIHYSQFIHAQFKVRNAGGSTARPLVAQQAFLRFVHTTSGQETIFVATPNENKFYSVVISVSEVAKSQFRSHSGEYTLSIVVGDAFVQNPISWTVSQSVSITFEATPATPANPLAAKPELKHKFREPAPRPSALISTVFTGLAFAPIVFLLGGFLSLGANINKFPTGTDFFSAAAFVVLIAVTLLLIAVFWLSLNLVQTLGYLAILALPTVFFGQRALSSLAKKEKVQ